VKNLEIAWTYPTGDDIDYAWNLVILEDMMYVRTKNNSIVALDAASGRELWVYHPDAPRREMHRGISYWESADRSDRHLLITFNNSLQAIDARTGKLIESFGNKGSVDLREGLGRDPKSIAHIQSATPGRVFENLIILGSFPGEQYLSARRWMKNAASFTYRSAPHLRFFAAPIEKETISSPIVCSHSMRARARVCGIISWCITTSGITTPPLLRNCSHSGTTERWLMR
jgi:hypothetical protein